jgi:hypothetical protein
VSAEDHIDQIEVSYRKRYDLGMGVKAATDSSVGLGVVGSPTPVQGVSGGAGDFQMTKIQATEELEKPVLRNNSVRCASSRIHPCNDVTRPRRILLILESARLLANDRIKANVPDYAAYV